MSKRVVVAPDLQAPYVNWRQVNALGRFIKDIQPDDIYCVGDLFDLPMVSRWERGRKGEFDGKIQEHIDTGRRIIEKLGIRHLKVGNHERRVETYVDTYAPALSPLKGIKMETLFGLEDLGCELHRDLWEFTPGWRLAHGDEGSISKTAGLTALNLAKAVRSNIVCGHTHRLGYLTEGSTLLGVSNETLHAVEAGHFMNLADASYLKSGIGNWTSGFVVLDISNQRVSVQVIPVSPTGSFAFEGRSFDDRKKK